MAAEGRPFQPTSGIYFVLSQPLYLFNGSVLFFFVQIRTFRVCFIISLSLSECKGVFRFRYRFRYRPFVFVLPTISPSSAIDRV